MTVFQIFSSNKTDYNIGFLNLKPAPFAVHHSVLSRKLFVELKFSAKVRWWLWCWIQMGSRGHLKGLGLPQTSNFVLRESLRPMELGICGPFALDLLY